MVQNDDTCILNDLYDKMDIAVMVLETKTGEILYVNQRVCQDMELTKDQIIKKNYRQIFWKEFQPVYESLVQACADGKTHTDIFDWTSKKMWEQISACQLELKHGQSAILLTITNITDVSLSLYEFMQIAYHDPLLHLPNRLSLKQDIDTLQSYEGVGIIRFDIRHLSSISDLYGWESGDLILQQIKAWLFETSTTTAKVYRVFEVGFCLLVKDTTQEGLEKRATQIENRFRQPWTAFVRGSKVPVYLNISMGIIWENDIASEAQTLIFHSLGDIISDGTRYIRFGTDYFEQMKSRIQLRQNLISSLRQGMTGFSVYYQPIVEVKTGRWAGVEALCRWETIDSGKISPSVFIKEAEQMGLVSIIDDWVHKTAIKDCWNIGMHEKAFHLDINFSPSRKIDETFTKNLISFCNEIGYPKEKLVIEITESTQIDFSDEVLANLQNLKKNEILLALDDFGTGCSSFEGLLRVSANVLKTDRSMVQGISTDANKRFLMKMLIDFSRYANMYFIVEGIETGVQKELLQGLGVNLMQGFLYGEPFPIEVLRKSKHRFD